MHRVRRWRYSLLLPPVMALLVLGVSGGPGLAATRSPAARPGVPGRVRAAIPQVKVTAVVVKSWGRCSSGGLVWDDLNANWSNYGTKSIFIDYSNPTLCNTTVTLSALKASGADVVILSNPAGGVQQFSASEATALHKYAAKGHNLIGTYLTFAYPAGAIDNSALIPLFGLRAKADYAGGDQVVKPTYKLLTPDIPLFRNLPSPYVSTGLDSAQTPVDGDWNSNESNGASFAARTAKKRGAITFFTNGRWDGIYISNMPEYGSGPRAEDEQFLYNAITEPPGG